MQTDSASAAQHLTFTLAGHVFAMPLLRVREIVEYADPTPVPQVPPFIRGMMNLRGRVVPVIDLALKLDLPKSAVTRRTCVVIVETASPELGVLGIVADSVSQVIELDKGDVLPPPDFGMPVRLDYLRGLGNHAGHFVLMLDVDRVLSFAELIAVSAASQVPATGAGAETVQAEAVR